MVLDIYWYPINFAKLLVLMKCTKLKHCSSGTGIGHVSRPRQQKYRYEILWRNLLVQKVRALNCIMQSITMCRRLWVGVWELCTPFADYSRLYRGCEVLDVLMVVEKPTSHYPLPNYLFLIAQFGWLERVGTLLYTARMVMTAQRDIEESDLLLLILFVYIDLSIEKHTSATNRVVRPWGNFNNLTNTYSRFMYTYLLYLVINYSTKGSNCRFTFIYF